MEKGANVWSALPSILWFLLVAGGLLLFRAQLAMLVSSLVWRVKAGGSLKLGTLELGASYVSAAGVAAATVVAEHKDDGSRFEERRKYYEPNRRLFLVHRISPSKQPGQLYDILLYVVPHKDATLVPVQHVAYYFGKHWGSKVFTVSDRASGFSIATSAFGPFVCTAEVRFTDGVVVMLSRYIDFEMGAIGKG